MILVPFPPIGMVCDPRRLAFVVRQILVRTEKLVHPILVPTSETEARVDTSDNRIGSACGVCVCSDDQSSREGPMLH